MARRAVLAKDPVPTRLGRDVGIVTEQGRRCNGAQVARRSMVIFSKCGFDYEDEADVWVLK